MRQIYSLRLLLVVVYLIVVVRAYNIDFSRKLTKPDQQLESNKKLWIPRKSTVLHARKQIPVPVSRGGQVQDFEAGPPPDLPSLMLQNRIIYVGMPLVPSVTELVIGQLLCLSYQNPDAEITLYINSPGTNSPDGKPFSFDTEAFAIADTLLFVPCPIRTVCVGQAFGTAAMLLGLGQKGKRFALPNASIMLHQPRSRARGQAVDVAIKAAEIANNRKTTNELLAKACGKDFETIEKDSSRVKYFSAEDAVEYGLIDAVLYPGSSLEKEQNLPRTGTWS